VNNEKEINHIEIISCCVVGVNLKGKNLQKMPYLLPRSKLAPFRCRVFSIIY
jgi:hypothetical protein